AEIVRRLCGRSYSSCAVRWPVGFARPGVLRRGNLRSVGMSFVAAVAWFVVAAAVVVALWRRSVSTPARRVSAVGEWNVQFPPGGLRGAAMGSELAPYGRFRL